MPTAQPPRTKTHPLWLELSCIPMYCTLYGVYGELSGHPAFAEVRSELVNLYTHPSTHRCLSLPKLSPTYSEILASILVHRTSALQPHPRARFQVPVPTFTSQRPTATVCEVNEPIATEPRPSDGSRVQFIHHFSPVVTESLKCRLNPSPLIASA